MALASAAGSCALFAHAPRALSQPRSATPAPHDDDRASDSAAIDDAAFDDVLSDADLWLDRVVVTASRGEEQEDDAVERALVIRRDAIDRSGARDLGELLEEQPNIRVLRSVRGQSIEMDGLDPQYTLVLVDGDRMPGRTAGAIDLGRYTLEDVERVEVVRGAASSLYGSDAIAGVVNLVPRAPSQPLELSASLAGGGGVMGGVFDGSGSVGSKRGPLALRLSFAGHTSPSFIVTPAPGVSADAQATTASARTQWSVGGHGWWELARHTRADLRIDYLQRRLEGVDRGAGGAVFDRTQLGEQLSIGTGVTFGARGKTQVRARGSYALSREQLLQDQRQSNALDTLEDSREHLGQISVMFDTPLGDHLLSIGVEQLVQVLDAPRLVTSGQRTRWAGFVQDEWTAVDTQDVVVAIVPGARIDLDTQFGTRFSPKLATRVDLGEHLVIRASYGWGFRAPSFQELLLHFENPTVGYVVDGNPALGAETARSGHASVEVTPVAELRITAGVFRTDVLGMITTMTRASGPTGTQYSYVNLATAYTQGVDLSVRFQPWSWLTASIGYVLLGTHDGEHDRPLDGRPAHRATGSLAIDERASRFSASVRAAVGSERVYYATAADGTVSRTTASWTAQLDARVGYAPWSPIEFFVGVDNVFDAGDVSLALSPRTFYAGARLRVPTREERAAPAPRDAEARR